MPRKIILTVTSDLNTDQRMQRICLSLHNGGYDVLLVGRKLKKENISFDFPSKRISCLFKSGFLIYAEFNIRIFLFLLFSKMDLICSIDLDTILPGRLVSRIKNKKQIYDAHEFYTESPELDNRPRVKSFWEWIGRKTVPFVNGGYTVNRSISNLIADKYNMNLSVIRNLPKLIYWEDDKSASQSNSYLLYQGVLNKGRGLKELIAAMKDINEIPLWIAGSGDEEQELKQLVHSLNLSSKVNFLGKLSPAELRKVTKKALLGFNLLDPQNKNYYYSLANKFFDYMMAGIPSVSMDFPEYQQINKELEFSFLISDLEVANISNAINTLLTDPEKYQHLKLNCKKAASIYNWANEEKELLRFYNNLFLTE